MRMTTLNVRVFQTMNTRSNRTLVAQLAIAADGAFIRQISLNVGHNKLALLSY
jgi:hypothetical protein